jgi:hypothetical protein
VVDVAVVRMTLVRASFRKAASDGNYGTEAAECTLEVDVETPGDGGDLAADVAAGLLAMCRRRVHDELRSSPSGAVRRALEYPKTDPVDDRAREADDEERMPF